MSFELAEATTERVGATESFASDAEQFATLQARLETAMEQCRDLRKELRPLRRRLHKHMLTHELTEMQCPPYLLRVESPSGTDDDAEDEGMRATFTQRRVSDFLTAEQYTAYCAENPRPKRKRRIVCERNTTTSA